MSIFVRIWLAFTIVLLIGGFLFFTNMEKHVKPTAQQVVEDTLIDTSTVLASIASEATTEFQMQTEGLDRGKQRHAFERFKRNINLSFTKEISAKVWNNHKQGLDFHIYITDKNGIVIYDSQDRAVGADYSQWRDVYLTLRGKYGARASQIRPNDPTSSVMYVASPIYQYEKDSFSTELDSGNANNQTDDDKPLAPKKEIIGVLTVGKPNVTLLPYLDLTYDKMVKATFWVGLASLILAGLVALWIRRSIFLVNRYTQSLAKDADKPYFFLASELNDLSNSIETMRDELENKAYVTQYVHTLTHELKSPITAIQASSELLADDLPEQDREQFSNNIHQQCQKLQGLVERMLLLAKLEQPNFKLQLADQSVSVFIDNVLSLNHSKIKTKDIELSVTISPDATISADKFWFEQLLQNIIENAIHFCESKLDICVSLDNNAQSPSNKLSKKTIKIVITNTGRHIPSYALSKLFDRYFSLPKNEKASKGTGIGLTLVKEVADKHGWQVQVKNTRFAKKTAVSFTLKGLVVK